MHDGRDVFTQIPESSHVFGKRQLHKFASQLYPIVQSGKIGFEQIPKLSHVFGKLQVQEDVHGALTAHSEFGFTQIPDSHLFGKLQVQEDVHGVLTPHSGLELFFLKCIYNKKNVKDVNIIKTI